MFAFHCIYLGMKVGREKEKRGCKAIMKYHFVLWEQTKDLIDFHTDFHIEQEDGTGIAR